MKWSDEVLEFVEMSWRDGKSAGEIALVMSKLVGERITRNVVIGIVHRGGYGRAPAGPTGERRDAPRPPRPIAEAEPPIAAEPTKKVALRRVAPRPPATAKPKTYAGRKPLEDRGPDECAWPHGDSPNILYCCKPRAERNGVVTEYCVLHNEAMWRKSNARASEAA